MPAHGARDSGHPMTVTRLHGWGGPEVLGPDCAPVPSPDVHEFLVRVTACGVCGHDVLARRGLLSAAPDAVLGHEIAGVVEAVGNEGLADWLGARVALVQRRPCGRCPDCQAGRTNQCRRGPGFYGDDIPGGYAQYVLADPRNAVRIPESIDDATAAVLSCGVGTGYRALAAAGVGAGDVVLITGASGGVGLNAVALACARGVNAIAATSHPSKAAALTEAGAAVALVAPEPEEVRKAALTLGRERGVDAVLEITGAPTFALSLRSLRPGGRLVLVGNTDPGTLPLSPGLTIVKELTVVGSAHATLTDLEEVVDLVAAGRFSPPPIHQYPLKDAAKVHAELDARRQTGRAVLVP